MESKYIKLLVLTDHKTHGKGESIYPLLKMMRANPACHSISVSSRSNLNNKNFFDCNSLSFYTRLVDDSFEYSETGDFFEMKPQTRCTLPEFDVIFLRIDRPREGKIEPFLEFISKNFKDKYIINSVKGIQETGSKIFLMNFRDLCPQIEICRSLDDVRRLSENFSVVLKPLESYGGKGLIKISGNSVWFGDAKTDWLGASLSIQNHLDEVGPYLAMEYLSNVQMGDKRIIVVNGEVMGATLRLPKEGSWLCNLSQGGSAAFADPNEDEIKIAETISPLLIEKGVVIYGFDTLVDNAGKRVLSEINTLNVGGLYQAEIYSKKPVIKKTSELVWAHIKSIISA